MSGNDRLTNQQGIRSTDQEHENGPPGAMEGTNPDVQARGSSWSGQQQTTALKERQDADLGDVTKAADTIDGGGTAGKT